MAAKDNQSSNRDPLFTSPSIKWENSLLFPIDSFSKEALLNNISMYDASFFVYLPVKFHAPARTGLCRQL